MKVYEMSFRDMDQKMVEIHGVKMVKLLEKMGLKLDNKLRVSGNLNKSAEPMYMHNEVITQGGISRCKVMYAVCSL